MIRKEGADSMDQQKEIAVLANEFEAAQKVLNALGDENRQCLILKMMQMSSCSGVRVGEITRDTHLSRPAVSRHLKVLKEAGIIKMRREGTRNYYYFDTEPETLTQLMIMLEHVRQIMARLPDRSIPDD